MSKMLRLTRAITMGVVMIAVLGTAMSLGTLGAKELPENDCLIGVKDILDGPTLGAAVSCTDGDACDDDGATNGSCTFSVQACANIPNVAGCTTRPLKKASAKATGKPKVTLPVDFASSVCGAFTDVVVKLKKKGKKPGKRKVIAKAIGTAKPAGKNKDIDKVTLTCNVCATPGGCVPPPTTTTTTTLPPCGNGTVDPGEACDPDASPNGCSGGTPFCNTATCASCKANCTDLAFRVGTPTEYCGFPGQNDPALGTFSGEIQDDTAAKLADLGLGCLYIGGGNAAIVPPGPVPDSSDTFLTMSDCSQNAPTLSGSDGSSRLNCSVGPLASTHCTNGHPGTDGNGTCASDTDCQGVCVGGQCIDGAPGTDGNGACDTNGNCGTSSASGPPTSVCLTDPACYFGAPLPIDNGTTSTCVLNVIKDGVSGTADIAAGTATIDLPLKSWVYLTGTAYGIGKPCPGCVAGVCNFGPRKDQSCVTANALETSHDCPPDPFLFLAPLDVTLSPLTTQTTSLTSDVNGIFCPGQINGGAFGVGAARALVQNGTGASGGFDVTFKDTTLASVFCIPLTGNLIIDGAADLPGPGSVALGGQARLR